MSTYIEHPFAQYVRILGKGKTGSRSLTQQEAREAFGMILRGDAEPVQVGAFLMLLRVKEESSEELAGFVQACRDVINAPTDIHVDIDWSSYAGKRRQLPWFIAVLLLLADNGYRVFMHGAKGHTAGRLYSEDAFTALGLPIAHDFNQVRLQLDQHNLSFMPVAHLCKPLHDMIEMRRLFGLRSPVHTLSRLINPLAARYSMQSIFHPAYADSHQRAAALLGQPNMVVFKGEGGEIERKPEAHCLVKTIINGELSEEKWPRLSEERSENDDIMDIQLFHDVWNHNTDYPYADLTVCATLAVVLRLLDPALTQEAALQKARLWWQQRAPRTF